MSQLNCEIKNPGCLWTAKYVCHHCGTPICEACDQKMQDNQFASKRRWPKKYPVAHHCPHCYHARASKLRGFFKAARSSVRGYLRKFTI